MALRCKPGDLALVIRSGLPEMVGRMVIVERAAKQIELILGLPRNIGFATPPGDFCWMIRATRADEKLPIAICDVMTQTRIDGFEYLRPHFDSGLLPIRPKDLEGEDEDEPLFQPELIKEDA